MCYEICPHCMSEVEIPADRKSLCPVCGREILPCSACRDCYHNNVDNWPDCDWTAESGCWRFKK
jgi:hypothetical protein